jgi:hypothetical protein
MEFGVLDEKNGVNGPWQTQPCPPIWCLQPATSLRMAIQRRSPINRGTTVSSRSYGIQIRMDQNLEWTTAVGEAAAARRRSLESPCALWSIFCAKSIADKTVINEPKRFSLSHSTLEGFSSAVLRRKDEHSPSLWLLPGQRSRSSAPHDA